MLGWALAGVAQWTEHPAANHRVIGLIPGQGTCLGAAWVPSGGRPRGNHTLMFLPLPSPLSKNK